MNILKTRLALFLALACIGTMAWSTGAPWYRWKNVVNRTMMCAKVTPGDAWEKFDGPYMDSRCKKQGNPQ